MTTSSTPNTEALRGNAHFQGLLAHAPRLAEKYLEAVDPEFSTARPEHKAAYLSYVTTKPHPNMKPFGGKESKDETKEPEAPKEFSPLNSKLAKALGMSEASRETILALGLDDRGVTQLLSKLSRAQIAALAADTPSKPRRRITKEPLPVKAGRRVRL
jgi:hypothetical protein